MNTQFKRLAFSEIIVFQPLKFVDSRGFFFENFNKGKFEKQMVLVLTLFKKIYLFQKNVLRGLHFQKGNMHKERL